MPQPTRLLSDAEVFGHAAGPAQRRLVNDDEVFGSSPGLAPGGKADGWEVVSEEPAGGGWEIESESQAGLPLPKGIKPNEAAGAGRGGVGGPTAEQLRQASARKGTARGVAPYVAPDPQPEEAPGSSILDKPPADYLDTDERSPWRREADAQRAIADAKRDKFFADSGEIRPVAAPGALKRMADSTLRKPLDNSLAGLALEAGGDAVRGVARGAAGIAGSVYSGVQAGLETVAGDSAASQIAGEAGRAARDARDAIGNPLDRDSITQQVFESTFTNLPVLATLGVGNTALLAMGAQAAANDYGESRDRGLSNEQALGRAGYMGAAEIIGERFGLPQLGQLFAKAAAKASTKEMGHILADMLVKEQIGEQVTTALQSGYEKWGAQGRKPGMTLADYLDDVANTAKVTLGQSLLMGGAAASVRALPQSPAQQIAGAIDQGVDNTFFTREGIDGFARAAMTPGSVLTDPNAVRPEDTRKPGALAQAAAPVAPRVEDMPTTPFTPEQTAAMAAEAQAQRAAYAFQVGQKAAQRADDRLVALAPQATGVDALQPRQAAGSRDPNLIDRAGADRTPQAGADDARGRQDRAGVDQPGQLPRGSLVDAARRQLSAKTPEAAPDDAASPTGQPQRSPGTVDESSAELQRAIQQAASAAKPAPAQPDGAGTPQSTALQAVRGGGTSAPEPTPAVAGPTFRSRDHAIAAAVEAGQYQRLKPVQESDGRWRLQDLQQQTAATAPTAAPPEAAPRGASAAPTDAAPPMAGSPATGQATPKQADQRTAGHLTRPSQPEAPTTTHRQVDLEQTAATAATGAAHADPGRQAEPASAPVVARSVAKAANQTDRKPAELRVDLVAQIDAALVNAPDEALPTWKQPTKARLRQAMVDLHLGSLERAEQALRTAHDNRVAEAVGRIGYVDFDVPGDGAFKVLRSASRLAEFRKLVERSAGFKAQRPGAAPEPNGAHRGSASTKAAIEAMLDEGDAQAAVDYAAAKGVDVSELDLSPSRLSKLTGVTPTAAADDEAAAAGADATSPADHTAAAAPPTPSVRPELADALDTRPHELTQAAFLAQVDIKNAGRGSHPWSATWRGHQLEGSQQAMDHPDLGRTMVMGNRFFARRRDAIAAASQAHERAVRRAQRQGDEVPSAVLSDYPGLSPKREDKPEPPADTLGIDRARLRGVAVQVQATIESTGEEVTINLPDVAGTLDKNDADWRRAVEGRFSAGDGIVYHDALSSYLAEGRSPEEARQLAVADELQFMRELHHDVEQAVRQQHPELFLGQPATTEAGTDDTELDAEKARIDDAGEKIGGARKDRWAERGMNLADLDAMTEAEGAELVTKTAVWRPDFAGMVAAGSHPKAVAMVKLVADSLAAKPKDNTPAGRRRYVAAMQAVRQAYGDLSQYGDGLHGVESMARQVLQRAADKLRTDLGVHNPEPATQREARAVLFSVYKGRSDPFSAGYGIEQRAAKLVADGFPGKAEPWTRRFEIRTIGGAGLT